MNLSLLCVAQSHICTVLSLSSVRLIEGCCSNKNVNVIYGISPHPLFPESS